MAPSAAKHGSARTKARKRALDILFEADLRGVDALDVLSTHQELNEPPVREFTSDLVRGVKEHQVELDALVAECLNPGWTLARMPRVDRNLARIAAYEIMFTDVAPEIAVAESVGLSQELSTDASPGFLGGVLGALAARRPA